MVYVSGVVSFLLVALVGGGPLLHESAALLHAIGMHFLISFTIGLSNWNNIFIHCTGRMALCSNHADWRVLSFIGARMRRMKRERRMKYLS